MSEALVLRGEVVDGRDAEIDVLEAEVKRLRRELAIANGEIAKAKADASRALTGLRKQLTPLYRALQSVFGELDAVGVENGPMSFAADNPRVSAVWNNWKSKLGGGPSKVIDALLLHGDMNTQQLAIACGCDRTTIPGYIHRLNKAGLINKNGGRFSLKQL
jgi:hypothetical protein